ncbi:MAG: cupredoxin domain-containing protein [Candidatus Binatia bacterium]
MRKLGVRIALVGVVVGLYLLQASPAGAIHLFPLFPGDPTGDCGAALAEAPATPSAATVLVEGFFFRDASDLDDTVTINAGDSVTWRWLRFCHSVTPSAGSPTFTGTSGGPGSASGFAAGQDQLVKPDADRTTFTVTFTQPGTYSYLCVHHVSRGMTGTIVVSGA